MMIIPKYVERTQGDELPPKMGVEGDRYRGVSEKELDAALERCLRQMNDLGQDATAAAGKSLVHEVEQIQGELLRRARARHPSAQ
jgi:hypothetical protein